MRSKFPTPEEFSIFPLDRTIGAVPETQSVHHRGNEGPQMAEQWIEKLEKMFDALDRMDEERIVLAEYNLEGEADHWWKATKWAHGDISGATWEDFEPMFLGKYFPFTFRERKAREFELQTQGTMIVDEYEGRIAELSKYAPYLGQDPVDRARRYERGLNSQIRRYLALMRLIKRTLREKGKYCMIQAVTSRWETLASWKLGLPRSS